MANAQIHPLLTHLLTGKDLESMPVQFKCCRLYRQAKYESNKYDEIVEISKIIPKGVSVEEDGVHFEVAGQTEICAGIK
ncbi:hypothetical protein LSG31_02915 [Fodinisporobacter ferrooxydans]|uniref:Uncharacterized protein n=1 Tax=Fodinisporobacter ferrooxydans TaxID=2901836 RepID=A0ABY4CL34_9BACL|nr:hypothetical protein LSG31_02915 [Alicyclobacillaceae bacterium MYW30-H2]